MGAGDRDSLVGRLALLTGGLNAIGLMSPYDSGVGCALNVTGACVEDEGLVRKVVGKDDADTDLLPELDRLIWQCAFGVRGEGAYDKVVDNAEPDKSIVLEIGSGSGNWYGKQKVCKKKKKK
jgi:hypothetical protein